MGLFTLDAIRSGLRSPMFREMEQDRAERVMTIAHDLFYDELETWYFEIDVMMIRGMMFPYPSIPEYGIWVLRYIQELFPFVFDPAGVGSPAAGTDLAVGGIDMIS